MSDPDAASPAGWHADPADATRERWWDGLGWTEFTRAAPPPPQVLARRSTVREEVRRPPDAGTRAVAWIAWSPGWAVFGLLLLGMLGIASAFASLLVPVAFVLVGLVLVALVVRDRRQLYERGFPVRPHPAWIALGPIGYLVARWRAIGEGRAEIVLCIVLLALIGGGVFLYQAITAGLGALSELQGDAP